MATQKYYNIQSHLIDFIQRFATFLKTKTGETMSKRIAIIGAGISGLSIAYQLLEQKHKIVVYEKGKSLSQTSSSSSKLLHGGLNS